VADNRKLLRITAEQREELARLILSLADGLSYREIEGKLGASARTVSLWKSRFEQSGIAGLQGQHKGSKPRVATPTIQSRVIQRVHQKPSHGSTHWSCRKLAERLGLKQVHCTAGTGESESQTTSAGMLPG
jgi:transposase